MAFSSLADNQMVTYEEATTTSLLNGQSNQELKPWLRLWLSTYNLAVTAVLIVLRVISLCKKFLIAGVAPFTGPQYVSTNDNLYITNQGSPALNNTVGYPSGIINGDFMILLLWSMMLLL
jgi:hypothetical protein